MKKVLVNYGGILFFYLVVILGIMLLTTVNTQHGYESSSNFYYEYPLS